MSMKVGLLIGLVLVYFAWLSEAYMRYGLLRETVPQWEAADRCLASGYDGLAVIDTPARWRYAQLLLTRENVLPGPEVWIGLAFDLSEDEPRWAGDRLYGWGAWAEGQPGWTYHAVTLYQEAGTGNYVWRTRSSSYDNMILCGKEFTRLNMVRHANPNADPAAEGLVPLLSEAAVAGVEECGVLCGSVSDCRYLAYSGTGGGATVGTCDLFSLNATAVLAQDSGSSSAYQIYVMNTF